VILELRFTITLVKWSPGSYQTNNYTIDNLLFFVKHAELENKSKDWLPRNWDNVCAWSDIFCLRTVVSVMWQDTNPA
jgi:hypothetical protein